MYMRCLSLSTIDVEKYSLTVEKSHLNVSRCCYLSEQIITRTPAEYKGRGDKKCKYQHF